MQHLEPMIRIASLKAFRRPFSQLLVVVLSIGVVALAVGCGDGRPARVRVSGQITVDGKPLDFGSIAFYPDAGGRPGGAQMESGGNYSVTMYELNDGLPPGSYSVSVSAVDVFSDRACRWHAPKRYQDPETSGLTAEIKNKSIPINFDLTWEGDDHDEPWVEESR